MSGSDMLEEVGRLKTEIENLEKRIAVLHNENARAIMLIDKVDHEIDIIISACHALSIAEGRDRMVSSVYSIKGLILEYDKGGE